MLFVIYLPRKLLVLRAFAVECLGCFMLFLADRAGEDFSAEIFCGFILIDELEDLLS